MARHRFGVAILLDKGQYKRAMRYNFNRFIQKHGLIGVVNYGAAVYLLAAFVLVQLCRYGDIFTKWPTLSDLAFTVVGALCLGLATAFDCWLAVKRRPGDD